MRRWRARTGQTDCRCRTGVVIRLRWADGGPSARRTHECEIGWFRARVFFTNPCNAAITDRRRVGELPRLPRAGTGDYL